MFTSTNIGLYNFGNWSLAQIFLQLHVISISPSSILDLNFPLPTWLSGIEQSGGQGGVRNNSEVAMKTAPSRNQHYEVGAALGDF